ncbi:MAG: hypothetical protein QM715_05390 [Nibricoccus sp.]
MSRVSALNSHALRPRHDFAGFPLRLNSLAFPILRHARSYLAIGPLGRCRESHQQSRYHRAQQPDGSGDVQARAPPAGFF